MELGKIPPHDVEAEQAILGCMLTDRDSVISAIEVLKVDDFYRAFACVFCTRHKCANVPIPNIIKNTLIVGFLSVF